MKLTEQWKKGELDRGIYYIKEQGSYKTDEWHGDCWEDSWSENVEEVLAPVPSYEEWQASENYIDYLKQCISIYESKEKQATETSIAYNELAEENAQLKELLKECEEVLLSYSNTNGDYELYDKITNAIGEKK